MKKVLFALLSCCVLLGSSPSFAQFVIEPNKASNKAVPKKSPSRLMVMRDGDEPVSFDLARGMGRNVSFGEALAQIVPKGWEVDFEMSDKPIDLKKSVTWRGGAEWPRALEDVLAQLGLGAVVNPTLRYLMIHPYPVVAQPKLDAIKSKGSSAGKAEATAVVAPVVPEKIWMVLAGDKTVRGALARWSKEAGWMLSWEAPFDYPVVIETRFTGSFEDVLTKVVESLDGSDKPVQLVLYENKVARVVPYGTVLKR